MRLLPLSSYVAYWWSYDIISRDLLPKMFLWKLRLRLVMTRLKREWSMIESVKDRRSADCWRMGVLLQLYHLRSFFVGFRLFVMGFRS